MSKHAKGYIKKYSPNIEIQKWVKLFESPKNEQ